MQCHYIYELFSSRGCKCLDVNAASFFGKLWFRKKDFKTKIFLKQDIVQRPNINAFTKEIICFWISIFDWTNKFQEIKVEV